MLLAIVALAFGAACRSQTATPAVAVTADTYAVVNGRQIMRADVDKAFQRAQPSSQVASEAETLAAKLNPDVEVAHPIQAGRRVWVQLARGAITVNDQNLKAGDAAAISDEDKILIRATKPSELLLFDMA